jgi:hypothetical protein
MPNTKKYNRKKQLRERYAGVCEKTIDRWRKKGRIPKPDFYSGPIPFWSDQSLDQADKEAARANMSARR